MALKPVLSFSQSTGLAAAHEGHDASFEVIRICLGSFTFFTRMLVVRHAGKKSRCWNCGGWTLESGSAVGVGVHVFLLWLTRLTGQQTTTAVSDRSAPEVTKQKRQLISKMVIDFETSQRG